MGSKEELKGFHVVLVMARGKMMKYLEWMIGKGFVEMDSEGFVYLTKKGETDEKLVEWILEHIGRLEFPTLISIFFCLKLLKWF